MTDATENPQNTTDSSSGPDADPFESSPLAQDLRTFAGRNADKMLRKMRGWLPPEADAQNAKRQRRHRGGFRTWVWPAFFVTFAWFFYRKMYLEGAAFIVLPILLALLLPPDVKFGEFLPGLLAALLGGWLYLKHAQRSIAKADAQGLTGEARNAFLAKAGGVSVAGGVFGGVIWVALFALAIFAAMAERMPA